MAEAGKRGDRAQVEAGHVDAHRDPAAAAAARARASGWRADPAPRASARRQRGARPAGATGDGRRGLAGRRLARAGAPPAPGPHRAGNKGVHIHARDLAVPAGNAPRPRGRGEDRRSPAATRTRGGRRFAESRDGSRA